MGFNPWRGSSNHDSNGVMTFGSIPIPSHPTPPMIEIMGSYGATYLPALWDSAICSNSYFE